MPFINIPFVDNKEEKRYLMTAFRRRLLMYFQRMFDEEFLSCFSVQVIFCTKGN